MSQPKIFYTVLPCCLCQAEFVFDLASGEAFCADCEPDWLEKAGVEHAC